MKLYKLILPILLLFLIPSFTHANEFYELEKKIGQPFNKEWVVTLNANVDEDTLDAVYVMWKNEKVNVDIKVDKNKVIINANPYWRMGQTYTLFITDELQDVHGRNLEKSYKMEFKILSWDEYAIVLEWENFHDLDANVKIAHLGNETVVNPLNKQYIHNNTTYAEMDVDVISGNGKETIVVKRNLDFEYYVALNEIGHIRDSKAKVSVYNYFKLEKEIYISPSLEDDVWSVKIK